MWDLTFFNSIQMQPWFLSVKFEIQISKAGNTSSGHITCFRHEILRSHLGSIMLGGAGVGFIMQKVFGASYDSHIHDVGEAECFGQA